MTLSYRSHYMFVINTPREGRGLHCNIGSAQSFMSAWGSDHRLYTIIRIRYYAAVNVTFSQDKGKPQLSRASKIS